MLAAYHLSFDCRLEADNSVTEVLQSFHCGLIGKIYRQIANRCQYTCSYSYLLEKYINHCKVKNVLIVSVIHLF